MRVSLTLVAIPFILVSVIDAVPQPELRFDVQAAARAIPPRDAVLLILAGVIGATVARRLRLPAGVMIGPFMLGSVLYATGMTEAEMPLLLVKAAQLVIGTILGSRFTAAERGRILGGLRMSLLSLAVSIAVAATGAAMLHAVGLGAMPVLFLSLSPGGLAEMSLVALSLGADPVFVAVHHMMRILSTVLLMPMMFRRTVPASAVEERAVEEGNREP